MKPKRFASIQTRLAALFSVLFLLGIGLLTGFLRTSASAIHYNIEARRYYSEARQFSQAKLYLLQFERALNQFELTSDYDFLDEYNASYARLKQLLEAATQDEPSDLFDDRSSVQQLLQDIQALRSQFDQVVAAVEEEDWEAVVARDQQAYVLVDQIFASLDSLIEPRTAAIDELKEAVDWFTTLSWLAIALALPAFLVMAGVVAVTISGRLHASLIRLADELKAIQAGTFDPGALGRLPERSDEVGFLAREYLQMATAVQKRQAVLQQEAQEIQAKIR